MKRVDLMKLEAYIDLYISIISYIACMCMSSLPLASRLIKDSFCGSDEATGVGLEKSIGNFLCAMVFFTTVF